MASIRNIAMQHCSNWNSGKCIGCMVTKKNGRLKFFIDSSMSDKDCIVESGCDYFESIVIPGIADDKTRESAKLLKKL